MDNIKSKSESRNPIIDIAKGIGILLVVLGHIHLGYERFIFLFHVPIFFIISGYLIKDKYSIDFKSVLEFIKRKINAYWKPFILANLLFLFCHNFFLKINLYTNNPVFLEQRTHGAMWGGLENFYTTKMFLKNAFYTLIMYRVEHICGVSWYLQTIFFVSISSLIILYIFNKITHEKLKQILLFSIFLVCMFIGYYLSLHKFNIYYIGTIFTSMFLFYLGLLFKKTDITKFKLPSFLLSISFLCLIYKITEQKFSLVINCYKNPLLLVISAICGFVVVMYVSKIISHNKTLSNIFSYIGSNTIYILCYHAFAFKFITLLQVKLFDLPSYNLASYHVLYNDWYWVILYAITGITIPLFISYAIKNIKKLFVKSV